MFGAKLSWCQIVRCQIVLVPNCPGAKLSTFIILVPNCPLLLSWCQIVRFIILVPNCPVPNCPVPNCPVPNCPTIPVSDKQWSFGRLWPSDTDDQCIQIIEVPCAQCTPCKASVLCDIFGHPLGIEPMTLVEWATHSIDCRYIKGKPDRAIFAVRWPEWRSGGSNFTPTFNSPH